MDISDLVHKANQIALFFAAYPREQTIAGIADHLQKFWEMRMKRQIMGYSATDGGGLHELVVEALKHLDRQ